MAVNGDATMLASWAMDAALVWGSGALVDRPPRLRRVLPAALIGSGPTLAILLGAPPFLNDGALFLGVPLMMWVALAPVTPPVYWRALAWLFGLTVFVGGAATAVTAAGAPVWVGLAVGAASAVGGARQWRRAVEVRAVAGSETIRIRCIVGRVRLSVTALVDTGNRLVESETGRPVVLVSLPQLSHGLAEDTMRWCRAVLAGDAPGLETGSDRLTMAVRTATGRRVLPVLLSQHGEREVNGQWQPLRPLAMALTDVTLSRTNAYQALIGPEAFQPEDRAGSASGAR